MKTLLEERDLIDAVSVLPRGREALGVWLDVVQTLLRSAGHMRAVGEHRQADALEADATSMTRRARLHLRAMVARGEPERASTSQEAP